MAQICNSCQRRTSVIHCLTENANLCLTCDYLLHVHVGIVGHLRYQLCDDCSYNPATMFCSIHRTVLCQPCYLVGYNCATYGHRIQILSNLHPEVHTNNHQQQQNQHQHEHVHVPQQQRNSNHNNHHQRVQHVHVPRQHYNHASRQTRERMFEMGCKGNNNCERWVFAIDCEACLGSNAAVYCYEDDQLLCNNCDRMIHKHGEVVPPHGLHRRQVLCVTCKKVTNDFLVGNCVYKPPTVPAAAEEVSASATIAPNHQDSNLS